MWRNNLKSSVKPIFFLCQIFGLHFETINFYKNSKSIQTVRVFLQVYSVCLLSTIVIVFFHMTKYNIIDDVNIIVQVADIVVTYSNLLLMIINICGNYFKRNEIKQAFLDLVKTESKISDKLNIKLDYKILQKFVVIQLSIAIFIWIVFGFYYYLILCTRSAFQCTLSMISYYISTKVSHVHVLQLSTFFLALRIHFKALNTKLSQMYAQCNDQLGMKSLLNTTELKNSNSYDRAQLKTFMTIRQLYDQLCDTSRTLNSAYSLPLLFTFANAFVVIFCSFYGCLFGFVLNGKVTDRTEIKYVFLPLTLLGVTVIKILTMTFACDQLSSESKCTGAIIHKISIATEENYIKETVQDFSLQLMHQSLQISAFGFFTVDCSLLQTIIGAVTTYLVILIQFDLAIPKNIQSIVSANITQNPSP